ncbi:SDR family oxidoreductase [Craurococcus roseus]|uniref:SDR family oxidoreductase n=1 Tax=Craurococcus roseus TaxID=77585 RepID=A0ABN1FMA6_9PROT
MAEARVVLVVGASGAAAARIAERAATAAPGFGAVGLSRRVPDGVGSWIAADLLDAAGLARALSARPDITHVVYASRAPHAESGVEDVGGNLAMLRNLLDAAEASLPRFAHIHLVQGGKWYGMHIGPYRTPAREDDPRHMPPNFYYDQQDLVSERRRGKAWAWTASRPGFVLDVVPGRARNMVSTLGAYAAICRELGLPFDFPGKPGAWEALLEVTDAALLADGVLWMLGEPRCADRAFNVANGDCFRWRELWPHLAELFGLRVGAVRTMPLARWMADKAPVWERVRARHGLVLPLERVADWAFADFFLGLEWDVLSSMAAARAAGFTGSVDTWAMFTEQIAGYRAARVLPPA